MIVLLRHPLVRAGISDAVNWHEDQQSGLELEFAADFLIHHRHLVRNAQLYGVRFGNVRRLNLDRFPYGLFYIIRDSEIWLLGVLHASRDNETILAERRRHFRN